MEKTISLSAEEAEALIRLIDVAIKAQGLGAAQAGLVLASKIQEAFKEELKEEEPSEPTTNPKKK